MGCFYFQKSAASSEDPLNQTCLTDLIGGIFDISGWRRGRRSGFGLCHTVAYAYLSEEVFRLSGIFLNLAADVGHVDPENLVVSAGARPPQLLDDVIIGQNPAGVLAEERHDSEFTEG